ncbi:hypothetical protein [Cryptosporangium japonicum]|uniref:Uncharacterized protein n=1 Tax=Cryptosporangium japonicum TaxID=80872 RepID=A0ABP3EKR8_9ACTN
MRRVVIGTLVVVGAVLMTAALQGAAAVLIGPAWVVNPGHYAALNRVFEHPVLLAAGGVVALLVALAVASRQRFLQFGAVGIAVLLTGFAVVLGTPVRSGPGLPTGGRRIAEYGSPDGRFTAEVTRWNKLQGPAHLIVVRSREGLRSREYLVGCQDGNGGGWLKLLEWIDTSTIRLHRSDGEKFDVRLDATTAEPDRVLYHGDVDACYQL